HVRDSAVREMVALKMCGWRVAVTAALLCAGVGLAWAQEPPAGVSAGAAVAAGGGKVEPIVSMRSGKAGEVPKHKKSYDVTVKDTAWVDTGMDVAAGEVLNFEAKGEFTLNGT